MKIRIRKWDSLNFGIEVGIKQIKHISIYFLFWSLVIGNNRLSDLDYK